MVAPYCPKPESVERFSAVYLDELARALREQPEECAWPAADLPRVHAKMVASLVAGTANKDSGPIRRTCKRLGIRHTYKALRAYFEHGTAEGLDTGTLSKDEV